VRTIGVVTVGRSDYGIYLPILQRIQSDPGLRLALYVGGMHLMPAFGLTVRAIEADGFPIVERVDSGLIGDAPVDIARALGAGVSGFAEALTRSRPDVLVVLGDRFDMFAAPVAALPMKIPVAHIHGGEITRGAMDDALRHAMTKLSHLHFVSTEDHARRVIQMGEEPWRVTVSGAPALDHLGRTPLLSKQEMEQRYGMDLSVAPVLVTYHPVTLEHEEAGRQAEELLEALRASGQPVVFTLPNADTGGQAVIGAIRRFLGSYRRAWLVDNLGAQAYFSFMSIAAAMVGNSSSGIIEAPSFKLPVVNIGTRQEGRTRARNVIDVGYHREEIRAGLDQALSASFRAGLSDLVNPYGDGHAAERIVNRLKEVKLGDALIRKVFADAAPERGST
jgi:UDP-N-acetylglucosamine 2-epimerase (non-hydrolysing)